ncbi:RN121 [Enterospora canceri]|uniref:RN121 n=1 Tax=Enterospora canceri TaxID=1081671 RepID=A0A1Y1S8C2_9MICR|nr:RN121 [Enterospora canceri]
MSNTFKLDKPEDTGMAEATDAILETKAQSKPVILHFIVLRPPITLIDVLPFVAVFGVYCLVIHTILALIKRVHRPTHNALVMFFIVAFPPITMMVLRDYVFITIWALLMLFFAYCVRIGFSRGLLAHENPKKIYRLFKKIFTATNFLILLSQAMVLLSRILGTATIKTSLRFLIYSVYFGVFCREVMFNLSRIMAQTTGYYTKDDSIAPVADDGSRCMICSLSLQNKTKIFTNTCGHSFHMECIKGWALLANNFFCIYCKRPIDDTNRLTRDLWYKAENTMRPIMNFLRSSISFFVVIYIFMMIRLR